MYIKFANKKYNERNPKIAKMLDVYKIKGSSGAIAKMAGYRVFEFITKKELSYNKPVLVNPYFVVSK